MPAAILHRIRIGHEHLATLRSEAQQRYPIEACALLLGQWVDGGAEVRELFLAENSAQSPVMFRIAPQDLLRGYEQAERVGLEVVGIFHSHPAPAWPSRMDLEYMRINPVIWLIMSMPSGEQRAFQLRKAGLAPVDIQQA